MDNKKFNEDRNNDTDDSKLGKGSKTAIYILIFIFIVLIVVYNILY